MSLKLWNRIIQQNNLKDAVGLLRWCGYDQDFTPNQLDTRFKEWTPQGLTAYCTFLHKGNVKDFQTLKASHGLNKNDFFRFLQVRNYIEKQLKIIKEKCQNNILVEVFMDAYIVKNTQKSLSRLYRGLRQTKNLQSHVKQKWEKEGHLTISVQEWKSLCRTQWKTSNSATWKEFCWKNLVRFFKTPVQGKHHTKSSDCWRKCGGQEGNHHHIFWSCPKIIPFWKELHNILRTVFKMDISFQLEVLYLGVLRTDNVSYKTKYLFQILSAAARKAITRKWLKPQSPTINDWVDIVYDIYKMEKITFNIRLQQDKFVEKWESWIEFIVSIRPDFI